MKSVSDLLQRTPWWALIFGGLATFAALAVFVTPYHIIRYREDARNVEESRAIKREIDNAFAENAIDVGRGIIRRMVARTTDPALRKDLEQALQGLEEARNELRAHGAEVIGAKREALDAAREGLEAARTAERELRSALRGAISEAKRAKGEDAAETQAEVERLREELREAQRRKREAERVEREARRSLRRAEKGVTVEIGADDKPLQVETGPADKPAAQAPPAAPLPPAPGEAPSAEAAAPPMPAPPALPPEVASKIRRDVTGDMYRIGIGALAVVVLLPLFIVAIVVKFFADRSRVAQRHAEAKRKEAEYHRLSQQVTEAKLAALQAQVEPHFLYNTLASVQALTEVDPARASEMTGHLIHYLRNALPKMRESVSTVGQEIELVRAYLSILQMRMDKRLAFEIDVPPELNEMPFPPLMLPSLVENAIKHGLEPQREGGVVRIGARVEAGRLRITVADTGRGFSDAPGSGVGLANIRERLAALYGESAQLRMEANSPQGVVATIEVPADGRRTAPAAPAAASMPPPIPAAPTLQPQAPAPAAVPPLPRPAHGFWPRAWRILVAMERMWRKALYYLYVALVVVTGAVCVGALVGVMAGALPVTLGDTAVEGAAGILIALAGTVVAFFAISAALGLVVLVLYGLGFLAFGVILFAVATALVSLFPVLAPFILIGLFVWWLMKRRKARPDAPPAAAPASSPAGPAS